MPEFPEWVRRQRAKGTKTREQNGAFYLYKITSVWDRKKGRTRKIREMYLGKNHHPSFFRMVSGSIGGISTVSATLKGDGVCKAMLIGDKAFHSKCNVDFLEGRALQYKLPLKRDSRLIDYTAPSSADRRAYDVQFLFEGRVIWHHEHAVEGRRIILFFDEKLKMEEGRDLIQRVHGKRKKMSDYYSGRFAMGTITVLTNTTLKARKVFELLKPGLT